MRLVRPYFAPSLVTSCFTLSDPRLCKRHESIDRDFRKENNIRYMKAEDVRENTDNNTDTSEVTKVRGSFNILAVSLKADFNKRISRVCQQAHGCVIKQRCSLVNPSPINYTRRSNFKFLEDMVVTAKKVQRKIFHSEVLKLEKENEQIKNKIAVLKKATTSTIDLVRSKHQIFESVMLLLFIYILNN